MPTLSASRLLYFISIITITTLLGCVAETTFLTNKATNYVSNITKMQILLNIDDDFGFESFETKIASILRECSVEAKVEILSNDNLHQREQIIKLFKPEVILFIDQTVRYTGASNGARYDMKLLDLSLNKLVWRASANFSLGDIRHFSINERSAALAVDLSDQLKKDEIFRSCPITKKGS